MCEKLSLSNYIYTIGRKEELGHTCCVACYSLCTPKIINDFTTISVNCYNFNMRSVNADCHLLFLKQILCMCHKWWINIQYLNEQLHILMLVLFWEIDLNTQICRHEILCSQIKIRVFLELKDVKYYWPLAKLYNFWNYTLNTERRIRVARWSSPTQGCMGWAMSMWRKPAIVLDL